MSRRRPVSKAVTQRKHAKRRAFERYSLWLGSVDMQDMIAQIQGGRAVFIERQSRRVTLWVVEAQGKHVPVVYDKSRKTIVTVLPEHSEAMRKYRSAGGEP
jgi:hypothetical protein